MEEQLPASLSEGQIAEFVENGEVLASVVIGDSSLPPCACFGFQAIDEIDCIEEAAAQAGADAASRDGIRSLTWRGSSSVRSKPIWTCWSAPKPTGVWRRWSFSRLLEADPKRSFISSTDARRASRVRPLAWCAERRRNAMRNRNTPVSGFLSRS
jgi:hypothetical protein